MLAEQRGISVPHPLLFILTCGLWLPIALYRATYPLYRCRFCGSHV